MKSLFEGETGPLCRLSSIKSQTSAISDISDISTTSNMANMLCYADPAEVKTEIPQWILRDLFLGYSQHSVTEIRISSETQQFYAGADRSIHIFWRHCIPVCPTFNSFHLAVRNIFLIMRRRVSLMQTKLILGHIYLICCIFKRNCISNKNYQSVVMTSSRACSEHLRAHLAGVQVVVDKGIDDGG